MVRVRRTQKCVIIRRHLSPLSQSGKLSPVTINHTIRLCQSPQWRGWKMDKIAVKVPWTQNRFVSTKPEGCISQMWLSLLVFQPKSCTRTQCTDFSWRRFVPSLRERSFLSYSWRKKGNPGCLLSSTAPPLILHAELAERGFCCGSTRADAHRQDSGCVDGPAMFSSMQFFVASWYFVCMTSILIFFSLWEWKCQFCEDRDIILHVLCFSTVFFCYVLQRLLWPGYFYSGFVSLYGQGYFWPWLHVDVEKR